MSHLSRDEGGPLADTVVVLGWFLLAALLGAVLWWQITPLAAYTRVRGNAVMGETEFGKPIASDGWFLVIGLLLGLACGAVLTWRRTRDPLLTVLLVVAGALLATVVMRQVGLLLGPPEPTRSSVRQTPVGGRIFLRLEPGTWVVLLAWPLGAMAGSVTMLLSDPGHRPTEGEDAVEISRETERAR